MADPLDRFVAAQADAYPQALDELRRGRKRGHWMWFVFPQLRGLGRSSTAEYYGIAGWEDARAYAAHPLLGARLRECAGALIVHVGRSAESILGEVDAIKLRSSMTLFERAGDDAAPFRAVLDGFYDGIEDGETLRLLGRG
ncbi:MAG TPA: DUF1810 domain-containing protein [Allosphingosinicella sp.]|nr:DUF1810 domain-containing protein [Allosphingosinicella sp.]